MMKKYLILATAFFLTACDKNYTYEDFYNDDDLRNSYVNKCKNGEIDHRHSNCIESNSADINKAMAETAKKYKRFGEY